MLTAELPGDVVSSASSLPVFSAIKVKSEGTEIILRFATVETGRVNAIEEEGSCSREKEGRKDGWKETGGLPDETVLWGGAVGLG